MESSVTILAERIRIHATPYREHFEDQDYVVLGTHRQQPLICLWPTEEAAEITYKIDSRESGGLINCKGFLQSHNYHHQEPQQYAATWSADYAALICDLSLPLSGE